MRNVRVSVIIPVYNGEDYLKECLDSVLSQTLKDIEIICVDDGSTDSTVDILNEYIKRDSRIMLLKQSNKYAGTARNLGMKYAEGKYLCFLDADDYFSAVFLEKMYTAAEQNASDVVICNNNEYDTNTGQITKGYMREDFLPKNEKRFCRTDIPDRLFQVTDGWPWNKLFLRDFIKKSQLAFSETRTTNDCYFVYMALAMAERITKISDYLVNWRINNMNSLSNTRDSSWYCSFQMLNDLKRGLQKLGLYKELEKTFINFAADHLMWSLERIRSYTGKEKIYDCIQKECRENLRITEYGADNYYNKSLYEEYRFIEKHTFPEYMAEIFTKRVRELEMCRRYNRDLKENSLQKVWMFPYCKVLPNSSIVLYGAGRVGQDYYRQILESGYCKTVLWLDRKFETEKGELDIQGWRDRINSVKFTQVVIALLRKNDADMAIGMLKEWGISEKEIVWAFED